MWLRCGMPALSTAELHGHWRAGVLPARFAPALVGLGRPLVWTPWQGSQDSISDCASAGRIAKSSEPDRGRLAQSSLRASQVLKPPAFRTPGATSGLLKPSAISAIPSAIEGGIPGTYEARARRLRPALLIAVFLRALAFAL